MTLKRGTVWWWSPSEVNSGHVQQGERPVIILSNNECNQYSDTVTVVPCTSQIKKLYPHQVELQIANREAVALCGQIRTIPADELVNYKCTLDEDELLAVTKAVMIHLGIDLKWLGLCW